MRAWLVAFGAAAVLVGAPGVARAELSLAISDGKVTLVADNVTVRQILAEWSRIGGTKVVGAERLAAVPVTLRLVEVPEPRALDTLLRSASGYVIASRGHSADHLSTVDRILIMPPSVLSAAASSGPGGTRPPVTASPAPPPVQLPQPAEEEEEEDPDPEAAGPLVNPYGAGRPAETNFDYANPQEMMQRRLELQQQLQQNQGNQPPALFPGSVVVPQGGTTGGMAPQQFPGAPATATRPGQIVAPPQPAFVNPYGLPYPAPQAPAAPTTPQTVPDQSKYANPYQPVPPKPPDD